MKRYLCQLRFYVDSVNADSLFETLLFDKSVPNYLFRSDFLPTYCRIGKSFLNEILESIQRTISCMHLRSHINHRKRQPNCVEITVTAAMKGSIQKDIIERIVKSTRIGQN